MVAAALVDAMELREIAEVVRVFGVDAPIDVRVVPEGLMNRNWRVTTLTGVYALKQVQDVGPAQVLLQHAATSALAARGLPVAVPMATPDGATLVEHAGSWWTLTRWIPGGHRGGLELALAECRDLGWLLAAVHVGLREVMPPAPTTLSVPVAEVDETLAAIDRYLEIAARRRPPDEFDRLVCTRLRQRRGMLAQLAHRRPDEGATAGRVGWVHGDFQSVDRTARCPVGRRRAMGPHLGCRYAK